MRIDMDLRTRSMTGILIYAVMLPAVFWPFDFHTREPVIAKWFALSMFIISLLRLAHWLASSRLYNYSPQLWRTIFTALSLSHAAVLSLFFALAIYDPRFDSILNVTMLAIGGIASSAIVALMPRFTLALTNLCILLLPSVVAGFIMENKTPFAIMIIVYIAFIAMMGLRSSKEYQRSFDIETELEEQKKILEKLNKIDGLTKIYNRGFFDTEFESMWASALKHQLNISLIFIDIDHFKRFNDEQGHLCGDACIVHVANILKTHARRKMDIVARYGGEEFVMILGNSSEKEAIKSAELIRRKIENTPFSFENRKLSVTASLGVSCIVPNQKTRRKKLIETADKALYAAKKSGRNRVKVA